MRPIEISDAMVDAARKVRECQAGHDRPEQSCLFCLNLVAWLGEGIVQIVARQDRRTELRATTEAKAPGV